MGKILVTAGDGRLTPIPTSVATGPGGTLIKLAPGETLEIDELHPYTHRALRNGDLVRVSSAPPAAAAKKE